MPNPKVLALHVIIMQVLHLMHIGWWLSHFSGHQGHDWSAKVYREPTSRALEMISINYSSIEHYVLSVCSWPISFPFGTSLARLDFLLPFPLDVPLTSEIHAM